MDCEKKFNKIVNGTKRYFKKAGIKKAVFGLSGGIDSSVLAFVLEKALGGENVFALHLPYDLTGSRRDLRDAFKIAGLTRINLSVFPIKDACTELYNTIWMPSKLAKANIQARTRMIVLYSFANTKKALVAGSSNRSELMLGYFTKYGDGACDIMPIASLYKTEVIKLAKWLGIPKEIIEKKPSAGLWRGQTDEKELGLNYKKIDAILAAEFDQKKGIKSLERKFGPKARKVLSMVSSSEHKKKMPFVVKR